MKGGMCGSELSHWPGGLKDGYCCWIHDFSIPSIDETGGELVVATGGNELNVPAVNWFVIPAAIAAMPVLTSGTLVVAKFVNGFVP